MMLNRRNLIPEWEQPYAIALVWPEHLNAGRGSLKDFYKDFISLLSDYIPVKILYCTGEGKYPDYPTFFTTKNVEYHPFALIGDIWLRDYCFFPVLYEGRLIPVKARYAPCYLTTPAEIRDGDIDDETGYQLAKEIYQMPAEKLEITGTEILLDGGNLIHNGNGIAIITNRIVSENENFFIDELKTVLSERLGITDLYLIPTEPGDDTGHADGLVRFISPKQLVISDYPYSWRNTENLISELEYKESQELVNLLARYFIQKGFDVIKMPNGIPYKSSGFESAIGNYTNFLRIGDVVFMPEYGNEIEDQQAKSALIKAGIDKDKIIGVPNCGILAKHGGVLNCITSHIYKP